MASENETVAEIRDDVYEYLTSIGPSEYPDEAQFEEFADRFVEAHKREVAELRECLEEAAYVRCHECFHSDHGRCEAHYANCMAKKWRKALEGAK